MNSKLIIISEIQEVIRAVFDSARTGVRVIGSKLHGSRVRGVTCLCFLEQYTHIYIYIY